MPDYAVRLRVPYADFEKVCPVWATKCDKMLVYEHTENAANIHVHLLLTQVTVTTENLKQDYRKAGLALKGPGQVSFKTAFKTPERVVIEITAEHHARYITYMTKGIYQPSYNKGFDPEFLEKCRMAWICKTQPNVCDKHYDGYVAELTEHITRVWQVESCADYDHKDIPTHRLRSMAIQYAVRVHGGHLTLHAKRLALQLYETHAYRLQKLNLDNVLLPGEKWQKKT